MANYVMNDWLDLDTTQRPLLSTHSSEASTLKLFVFLYKLQIATGEKWDST